MQEIMRYLICGVLTTIVSFISYFLITAVFGSSNSIQIQIATVGSWILSVLFAFFVSRYWVFEKSGMSFWNELKAFVAARIFTLGTELLVMQLLVFRIGLNDLLSKMIVQIIVTVLNYLFSKIVFRRKQNG